MALSKALITKKKGGGEMKAHSLVNSQIFCGRNVHELSYSCDHCEEKVTYLEVQKANDYALCSDCLRWLEILSSGKIKENIKAFLIRNVI